MKRPWFIAATYLILATAGLCLGILVNALLTQELNGKVDPVTSLGALALFYSVLHMVALAFALLISAFLNIRLRSKVYIVISVIGLIGSILLFIPSRTGGVHLFVVYWASLCIISLCYMWIINRPENV